MPDRDTVPQLSLFEGKKVAETSVKATGTITHVYAKPPRELRHGETLISVTVWECDKVAFPRTASGDLTREHTIKASEIHELNLPELDGRRLLSELRANTRKLVDRASDRDEVTITSAGADVIRSGAAHLRDASAQ